MAQSKKKKKPLRKAAKKTQKKAKKAKARPKAAPKPRRKRAKKLSKIELLQKQVKSLTQRLRKYEKQRFSGPLPEGKARKKPSKTEIETIRAKLKLFMEGVKRQLGVGAESDDDSLFSSSHAAKYRSHENENGSVDSELRIPLEDTGDVEATFIDIEEAGDWNSLSEFWVMIGLNADGEHATGSPTIDRRPHRAWTNPVRGNRAGSAFYVARETVVKKLEEWGANFSMIVIRLFWSPYNDRPARPRK